jgi:hypothetical protein
MPASDTCALQLYTPPPLLTKTERRDFKHDERIVARGLKSFLDMGLALKDIPAAAFTKSTPPGRQ